MAVRIEVEKGNGRMPVVLGREQRMAVLAESAEVQGVGADVDRHVELPLVVARDQEGYILLYFARCNLAVVSCDANGEDILFGGCRIAPDAGDLHSSRSDMRGE